MTKPYRKGFEANTFYSDGYAKARLPHYWEHLAERDSLALVALANRAAFLTGYYDGLADKYAMPRGEAFTPTQAADHSFC